MNFHSINLERKTNFFVNETSPNLHLKFSALFARFWPPHISIRRNMSPSCSIKTSGTLEDLFGPVLSPAGRGGAAATAARVLVVGPHVLQQLSLNNHVVHNQHQSLVIRLIEQ